MEFEKIKKDNRKKYIIGSLAILIIVSTIFFVATRANYKVTEKVNIANGIINYTQSDLSIVSIKISADGESYTDANTVPTSGYTLSSNSYCENNGVKDTSISIEYKDGKVLIGVSKKNTKCYLYFDIKLCKDGATACETILANKAIEERTSFSSTLTTNTTGKIYKTEDNDGISYYYAGFVDNNWVKFGGFYWRIIRINGDGTLRLIYNGTTTARTGNSTQIATSYFNTSYDDNAYVGYMYGTAGSSTYDVTHTNTNNSYVKQVVDEWYNTNLNKEGIKEYIDVNAGFCGDRSLASGTGAGTTATNYGVYNRLVTNKTPSLKCTNTNDLYTVSGANKGNKALTYPVGLITADEVAYAGGKQENGNTSYYLYTGQYYWTMSPSCFGSYNRSYVFNVNSSGGISYPYVFTSVGFRPVINLKADLKLNGDGTTTNPYEVV